MEVVEYPAKKANGRKCAGKATGRPRGVAGHSAQCGSVVRARRAARSRIARTLVVHESRVRKFAYEASSLPDMDKRDTSSGLHLFSKFLTCNLFSPFVIHILRLVLHERPTVTRTISAQLEQMRNEVIALMTNQQLGTFTAASASAAPMDAAVIARASITSRFPWPQRCGWKPGLSLACSRFASYGNMVGPCLSLPLPYWPIERLTLTVRVP